MQTYLLTFFNHNSNRNKRVSLYNPKTKATIWFDMNDSKVCKKLFNMNGNIYLTLDELNYLFSIKKRIVRN